MIYLILNAAALILILGFYLLTRYEAQKGTRVFKEARTNFDQQTARIEFIISHVDWNSYTREQLGIVLHRFGHDLAHRSLQSVRSLERLLTQVVRQLRAQGTPQLESREPLRPFVKTLSDFKGHLEATRPEMPEI